MTRLHGPRRAGGRVLRRSARPRPLLAAVAAVLATVLAVALAPASASAASAASAGERPRHGSAGVGDPIYPLTGNGGYDVASYDLDLAWHPSSGVLAGTATIAAHATQALDRFDLDFRTLKVSALSVNGRAARFTRHGQELVVTPARALRRGAAFTVVVRYAGVPKTVIDADDALDGWIPTDDGVFVASEPQGSPSWYPVNDTPRDKAIFTIAMNVPSRLAAVGNGRLRSHESAHGRTTYVWHEPYPMAPYLATMTIGPFTIHRDRTASGLPLYSAVDRREAAGTKDDLKRLPEIVDWEQRTFGRYPFDSAGIIVDHAAKVGYDLETQTRPVFAEAPDTSTVVHELAHQWYGDSVSVTTWQDIWLNEGFASYAEWLWAQHEGGRTPQQQFDRLYAHPAGDTGLWNPPPGDPGSGENLFAGSIYERGAMTLQALRVRIGDRAFFTLLRSWAHERRYGNATVADFEHRAEQVSGKNLHHFFQVWLDTPGKPTSW